MTAIGDWLLFVGARSAAIGLAVFVGGLTLMLGYEVWRSGR